MGLEVLPPFSYYYAFPSIVRVLCFVVVVVSVAVTSLYKYGATH